MMKFKTSFFALMFSFLSLFGSVDHSVIPYMNQMATKNLIGKLNQEQVDEIVSILPHLERRLRVMSFNMLMNIMESQLEPVDRWESRKGRVLEYIQWVHPDVIGSQELHADQLDFLMQGIGNEYAYYGVGEKDGARQGDIPAIFYRKERLELVRGETFWFSETPCCVSSSPFGSKNTFTLCHFRDKKSCREFVVLNTHLAFGNIERRLYEASKLRDFLLARDPGLPVVLMGDFNTFPFRQELDLPFYDGDTIVQIIERGGVADCMKLAFFGHFGPIASTNFCSARKKPFCSEGTPGVILDHIFISEGIHVFAHGIDPAKVDGHFPSDHFPVIADILLGDYEKLKDSPF